MAVDRGGRSDRRQLRAFQKLAAGALESLGLIAGDGIVFLGNQINVSLNPTNPGLTLTGGLAVLVAAGQPFGLSSGLTLVLTADGGLQTVSEALGIKLAGSSKLVLSAAGLAVDPGATFPPDPHTHALADLSDVSTAASTANLVLATPDGVAGDYSGRALVTADLPSEVLLEGEVIPASVGTAAAPGLSFLSSPGTGWSYIGGNTFTGGVNGNVMVQMTDFSFFQFLTVTSSSMQITTGVATISCSSIRVRPTSTISWGASITLDEVSTNGTQGIARQAPASIPASYKIEESPTPALDNEGILYQTASSSRQLVIHSKWANAMCFTAEENGALSTATGGGFQWSLGNGGSGDGFGVVIPFDHEILAIGVSVPTNSGGTATVEVYAGADAAANASATGLAVSLGLDERHNFAVAGTPVVGTAGDWITIKTTAKTGTVTNGRVSVWVRPRE